MGLAILRNTLRMYLMYGEKNETMTQQHKRARERKNIQNRETTTTTEGDGETLQTFISSRI